WRRKWSMTSGTPPARNTRTVGWFRGPFGSTSTSRGTRRFTSVQSSTVGRRSPAAWATAVRWRSRFVDPPKAAWTVIAFRTAASELGRPVEAELAVGEACADRLDGARVLAVRRRERHAPRHEHARQLVHRGERHYHRRQSLVAGGDPEHAPPVRQRADEPPEDLGRVVAVREAVQHSG